VINPSIRRCPDCYGGGWPWGDGKCSGCAGEGKSLSLSAPERECRECHGTGVCPTCGGEGKLRTAAIYPPVEIDIRPRAWHAVVALLLLVVVFGPRYVRSHYLSRASVAAEAVHAELSRGQLSRVYADADEVFRASASLDSVVERFGRVRQRLGDCRFSGPTGWGMTVTLAGVFVTTTYRGSCTKGEPTETLRWHFVDGTAKLAAWRVDSQALLRGAPAN
jgi:hypothetical protein